MTKREPWIVLVLTFVTCGLYQLWWQYTTTEELRDASGHDELNPATELILTLVSCGLFGIYVAYRNAQLVHETFAQAGAPHDSKAQLIVILYAVAVFNGVTALLAPMILQDEYNKLEDRLLASSSTPRATV